MGIDKILTLVDVLGTEKNLAKYRAVVESSLPSQLRAEGPRYWSMYAQIAKFWIESPKVTNKASVISCMYNAAKFGFNPDPIFGQIYFIPYKGVLQYQVGYKGMVALAYRSGVVSNVRSGLVYEKDTWHFYEDENGQHYRFEPKITAKDIKERGPRLFAYSIFTDMNKNNSVHVMPGYHIEKIYALVKARMGPSSTPWDDPLFRPEMEKKTCFRQHAKMEPFSAEIVKITEREESNENGNVAVDDHPELVDVMSEIIDKQALTKELDLLAAGQTFAPESTGAAS